MNLYYFILKILIPNFQNPSKMTRKKQACGIIIGEVRTDQH